MEEVQKVLDQLKTLNSKSPVLASPELGKILLLNVAATTQVVSTALVVEREEPKHVYKVQRSVYYISKVFPGYKTCYNQVQKLLYAILIMKHKLLHYFKSPRSAWLRHTGLEKLSGTASPREGLPSGLSNSWGLT
jgi:hypothetical protein